MNLDDLISQVQDSALTDDPIDRLSTAMGVKSDLDDLTDSLIGHLVDHARRAGRSWSEIGAAMGVTKQAAQQRHTAERPRDRGRGRGAGMFTRFSPDARAAVHHATAVAEQHEHAYTGTEHLLVGVLSVEESVGARVLMALGLTREAALTAAMETAARDDGPVRRRRRLHPFTPRAKKALELSFREAVELGDNTIRTEHLLLGLLRERECMASKLMVGLGITRNALLTEVTKAQAA